MSVNVGRGRLNLNVKIAYPGKLGGGLPVPPPGKVLEKDENGNYVIGDGK
jgi:hypothetical protein